MQGSYLETGEQTNIPWITKNGLQKIFDRVFHGANLVLCPIIFPKKFLQKRPTKNLELISSHGNRCQYPFVGA